MHGTDRVRSRTSRRVAIGVGVVVACAGVISLPTVSDAAAVLPSAPRFPSAMPRSGEARVTWARPAHMGTKPITAYLVTPYLSGVAGRPMVVKGTVTSKILTGLKNGKAYTFRVAARSSAGTGVRSAFTAPIVVGSPSPPSGLSASPGDARAVVSWTKPAQSNGADVTGYVITAFVRWAPVKAQALDGSATSGVIDGLANGVTHRFRVRARNARGLGPPSAEWDAAVPAADSTPPTNARPPAGGYFAMLPPGSTLPSESACAAMVHRSTWEPRPGNAAANHTVPPQPLNLASSFDFTSTWKNNYFPRITGKFTGTTDEIIQWAACKWGWSDNVVRAQAVRESHWSQAAEGDFERRSNGHCVHDDTRDPCPTSFGITQVKWYFHPQASSSSSPQSSYPLIKRSTAFNLDLLLAEMRGCYEGLSTYLGNTRGNLWGCIGSWYSGSWDPNGGNYVTGSSGVQQLLAAKEWLRW